MMHLSAEDARELQKLEEELLRPEVRHAIETMDMLLADDFVEFGRSGRIYDKADILTTAARHFAGQLSLVGFSAKALAPSVALVTYRSMLRHADSTERHALRSSIWKRTEHGWKLAFHQGAPTAPVP